MANPVLSDSSDQCPSQAIQMGIAASVIPQNSSGDPDGGILTSASDADNDDKELDEARRAVALLPYDHPEWLDKAKALTSLLWDRGILIECIEVERQICAVCTKDNSERAIAVSSLATSLLTLFEQTGKPDSLSEAIELGREALSLRPPGHPLRLDSCNDLAYFLTTLFEQTSDESLLVEAIKLEREALSLRSPEDPHRPVACSNLASSLKTRFDRTGDESLLAEAIELEREALSLRSSEDFYRSVSCNNLAVLLRARFDETGDERLLTQSIDLDREALSLRPDGDPLRSQSCNNLAYSLTEQFWQTKERSFLDEAIELNREALSLRPRGHPDRPESCNNLASTLRLRFFQEADESLMIEAINLEREALSLRPHGHHLRSISCSNLALSLRTRFEQTRDESMLTESLDLIKEALETQPLDHPSRWRLMISLIAIYLDRRFSQNSLVDAINYMHLALSLPSDDWPSLLAEISTLTGIIDLTNVPRDSLYQLLQCFSATVDLASRVAGFVLDPESQLRRLINSGQLGSRAYWCAIACGQPQSGLELIERARGMIWTQALHLRNPELSGAPPELASELESLLNRMNASRSLAARMSLSSEVPSMPLQSSTAQDLQYRNNARIHQLVQQIRTMPGHDQFMRGLSFEELAQCASRNAVVLLVAAEGECQALILQPTEPKFLAIKLSEITLDEVTIMSTISSATQMRGSPPDDVDEHGRGMKVSKSRPYPVLGKLWRTVVKPVLECLQLQVRVCDQSSHIIAV
jgi:hypothetical protein